MPESTSAGQRMRLSSQGTHPSTWSLNVRAFVNNSIFRLGLNTFPSYLPLDIPKLIAHRPAINAAQGGHATLYCSYESHPEGRAQWLRNGQVLESGDKYSFHADGDNRHKRYNLKVQKIDMEDLGAYTCEVTNKLGKGNVNVTIMYEPEMAVFVGSELLEDDFTSLKWTVNSAQPLIEQDLYYKKSGDKQWRKERPYQDKVSSESGMYK